MTNELRRYYSDLRDKNRRIQEKRIEECERKSARFRSLLAEPGLVFQQAASGKMTFSAARSRLAAIEAERRNLLISMGYAGNYLDPVYTCPICKDTGEVGEPTKLCACALKKQPDRASTNAKPSPTSTNRSIRTKIRKSRGSA